MKTKILVVMMLWSVAGFGQANVYHPFPDSGAVWRHQFGDYCFTVPQWPFIPCITEFQLVLKGDTVINSIKYSKIIKEEMRSNCYPVPPNNYSCTTPIFSSSYAGAIRNDTASRKVYYSTGLQESLLYDFSQNVGDTVNGMCDEHTIINIDSVQIGADYRKRFILDNYHYIIEGIGSVGNQFGGNVSGLLGGCGDGCVCNIFWSFTCFSLNGLTLYPDTSTCSIINTVSEIKTLPTINIYPNPTTSHLTIISPAIINKIQITDVLGQLIYHSIPNKGNLELHIGEAGLYFVSLILDKETVTRKVVVQR